LANGFQTRDYAQTEVALQWTLYDFGRTGGRYRQAVARERISELQLARANQTLAFDVTAAFMARRGGCRRTQSAAPGKENSMRSPVSTMPWDATPAGRWR